MSKRIRFLVGILLLCAVCLTYSNHFSNSFHFDDFHTIVNNIYIRDITNFTQFFTDINTFGAMPNNLGYRPVVTASTAIDYWMGNGYQTFYFHLSMFSVFLLQGFFMYLIFFKIFAESYKHEWTKYLAFFTVALYLLHPGNAETINYIVARSDSFSTFFVVLAFALYIKSKFCKKYFIYLLPVALGNLSKETAAMFPLLLFVYILLFENNVSLTKMFTSQRKQFFNAIVKTIPALLFTLAVAVYVQYVCYSNTRNSGIMNAEIDGYHLQYLITQPYILLTYFINFFFPVTLSSDPDFEVFKSYTDIRMYIGFAFVLAMFFLAFISSKKEKYRPIAFGILWFFIAAIPTSVLVALTQASNSHRLFYLYVGLSIAVGWSIFLLLEKMQPALEKAKLRIWLILVGVAILSVYAVATFQRNKVWKSDETLWFDILEKNPENPRAMMNYGVELMRKGDYVNAEKNFIHALSKDSSYTYLYVNLGILKNATGDKVKAEEYFKKAILCGDNSFPSLYYGHFLFDQMRYDEAIMYLEKSIQISPTNVDPRFLLLKAYYKMKYWDKLKTLAENTLKIIPGNQEVIEYLKASENQKESIVEIDETLDTNPTPEKYLNQSLSFYKQNKFEKCIEACNKALILRPDYADAYCNICAAYNQLQQWDKAILACEKALQINPNHSLAKGNLKWALDMKKK